MTEHIPFPPACFDISGKVCIVTGAASGIGSAIARQLAANGADMVIADVTTEVIKGGEPTAEFIARDSNSSAFIRTDVADTAQVDALVGQTVARSGRLDVLVNNACIRHAWPLLALDEVDWQRLLDVNLSGVYRCCRAAVRQMVGQAPVNEVRVRLINLSSQHGLIAAPGDLGHGTSKAAIDCMTRQIASDYAADLVVCNAVAPGKIQTGAGGHAVDPGVLGRASSRPPWPRLGRPEDIAQAVLFLASDHSTYMTGAILMVDGGWMAA